MNSIKNINNLPVAKFQRAVNGLRQLDNVHDLNITWIAPNKGIGFVWVNREDGMITLPINTFVPLKAWGEIRISVIQSGDEYFFEKRTYETGDRIRYETLEHYHPWRGKIKETIPQIRFSETIIVGNVTCKTH